ncbi:DUF6491 family protein [Fretibacter rubidus]|uniref:DUF6491 family protein n=1 Tax=Fretibacter rubidus TaxID=570162 RepID=UPI00352A6B6A
MKYVILSLTTLSATFLLASCATTASDEPRGIAAFEGDARLGQQVDKICFERNIDGFSNNTKDTVVLSTGPSRDYIVSVRGICSNLPFAQSIGLSPRTSCLRENDFIIVSESAFTLNDRSGIGPDRCYIDEIYEWDVRAEATDVDKPE